MGKGGPCLSPEQGEGAICCVPRYHVTSRTHACKLLPLFCRSFFARKGPFDPDFLQLLAHVILGEWRGKRGTFCRCAFCADTASRSPTLASHCPPLAPLLPSPLPLRHNPLQARALPLRQAAHAVPAGIGALCQDPGSGAARRGGGGGTTAGAGIDSADQGVWLVVEVWLGLVAEGVCSATGQRRGRGQAECEQGVWPLGKDTWTGRGGLKRLWLWKGWPGTRVGGSGNTLKGIVSMWYAHREP